VMFRADAALAKPEIYETVEEREMKYAIRLPPNDNLRPGHRGTADAPHRKHHSQTHGVVQGLSLPGGSWQTAR